MSDHDKHQTTIDFLIECFFFFFFFLSFFFFLLLGTRLTERYHAVVSWPFRCSHVAEDSDLLHTVCTVFSSTACTHQPPGAVPWQERLVRGQEHHTDSRAHGMSASLYSKQVRMKALFCPPLFHCLTICQYAAGKKVSNPEMSTCHWVASSGLGPVRLEGRAVVGAVKSEMPYKMEIHHQMIVKWADN